MSVETALYALLSQASAVTDIVGKEIWPVFLPQGHKPPALVYSLISNNRLPAIDAGVPNPPTRARLSVNLLHITYPGLKALRDAVVDACEFQRGTFGNTSVISVLHGGEGSESFDDDLQVYHQQVDFLITFYG